MLKLSNLESIGKPVYKFQNNHSVDFDGVDDFIQLGEPISYTQHTISTWIKVSDSDVSKTIIDARDSADDGIRIFLTNHEEVIYSVNTSDITSGSAISVDEWHHIVGTYDGTTQKLYIDGSLVSSATTSQTISTTTNAKIGSRNFSDRANEFLGKIDELAIYDRALEQEEVTKIYRIKYGANLVQNGNYDELGSEQAPSILTIVNNNGGTITQISGNSFSSTSDSTSSSSIRPKFDFNTTSGKTYKLVITPTGSITGTVNFDFFDGSSYIFQDYDFTTIKEIFFVDNGGVFGAFNGQQTYNITSFTISVKQVDPNDRWTLGTGWAYEDSKVLRTAQSGSTACDQNLSFTAGNTYKISYVLDITAGSFLARLAGTTNVNGATRTTSGAYTDNLVAVTGNNKLRLVGTDGTFAGSVTNVMVEEQKYVATNLKLNSIPYSSSNLRNYYRFGDGILDTHPLICDMVEPSLGSNVITNGTFDTDLSNWTASNTNDTNTITYENGAVRFVSVDQNISISQFSVLEIGKIYKFTCDVVVTEGALGVDGAIAEEGTISMTNGFNEIYFTAKLTTFKIKRVINASNCLLDNVAVKKVNGVPGMMTNMTEADITNDVPS